jgi:hypothetical protein
MMMLKLVLMNIINSYIKMQVPPVEQQFKLYLKIISQMLKFTSTTQKIYLKGETWIITIKLAL